MKQLTAFDPSGQRVLGLFAVDGERESIAAVARARASAATWRARGLHERLIALRRFRELLAAHSDELAALVTAEIGKPLQEAYGADILPSLAALEWLARNSQRALRPRRVGGATLSPLPYEVVGVIGTWNYPIYLNIGPIAWALAAGAAVVWKPSELGTACGARLAGLLCDAGLPVELLRGGAETGRALCEAGCDKIAFTGGVVTGRAILAALAPHGTPSVMELSGNDAAIVCADADIRLAARSLVWGRCSNAGQSCIAPQRIYVVTEQYDRFLTECAGIVKALRPCTDFGPMRSQALVCAARGRIEAAVEAGATVRARAEALAPHGPFLLPTLLADCTDAMAAVRDDFFGPVLPVCRVRDEAEAIRFANSSEMALGASVWTRDVRRGLEIANALRVGIVSVNDVLLDAAHPALPFGGLRASGFGKQRGAGGLDEFVIWKAVVRHGSGGPRRHLFPYRSSTLPILRGIVALSAAHGARERLSAAVGLCRAVGKWGRGDSESGRAE